MLLFFIKFKTLNNRNKNYKFECSTIVESFYFILFIPTNILHSHFYDYEYIKNNLSTSIVFIINIFCFNFGMFA